MDLLSSRLDTPFNSSGVRISNSGAARCASCTMRASFGSGEAAYSRMVSKSSTKLLNSLWDKKQIPEEGWPDHALELFLSWLACHDTNNRVDMASIGAGEREGRVACPLVRRLHCSLTHGIGRSGNIADIQPKALGSSMLACLANELALHAIQEIGITSCRAALVVPICTGMALSLCMGSWRRLRPEAKYVLWLRVDQKSCFKSIYHAGFEPIILDPIRDGDALVTDVDTVNRILEQRAEQILCVMSTTSCFAPRSPDSLEAISGLCQLYQVPHLVNNAYGLQSEECVRRINASRAAGRIDAFVQSLDKNFQVPVGGAIIGTFKQSAIKTIAQFYPGRASCVPSRDLVLTLLHQGRRGLLESYDAQRRLFQKMKRRLILFAADIGEFVYDVEDNQISLALTLSSIPREKQSLFGSVLFNRGITGARAVVSTNEVTIIEGCEFLNFGSHSNEQHGGYLNVACGVGMTEGEMEELFNRIASAYAKFTRRNGYFMPGVGSNRSTPDDDEDESE
uniref:O-phosphoseryl-tRNA(Sec) selenium transferase n=1 Tax=Haemonchus contortus TaxID=6289 RepID=A0A7I4YU70_HAECO